MSDEDEDGGEGGGGGGGNSEQQPRQQKAADRFQLVYEPSPIVPPDGGYGWMVVAAAFFVNLIADGVTFSFGILLSELFMSLDDSREDISWIGSFLAGVPLLLGPVTSLLIDKFGCRAVTIAGGLISGVGFALMFVLPQSTLLFVFSAGLLSGLGLGLVFMPAVVAVSFYFLEKRALATGLAMSGSGVGTVVFAYITRACIEEYTWRGSFLIVGGILLNVCVCGALYRTLEPTDLRKMKRMNRLYVQFQADTGNWDADRPNSSASPPASPTASQSPASSVASPNNAVPAKSVLSIPTYLAQEFNSLKSPTKQQPSPPDERQLIASLKLSYLQRLAVAAPSDASATVQANGLVANALAKASTSHELVDYAQQVARQKRRGLREPDSGLDQGQDQPRRLSIVVCLPQPQQQQQQHQQQSQSSTAATHRVRRQLFPVDRRYFMQHARHFGSCGGGAASTAFVELWDSCPEFGRTPAALHNRDAALLPASAAAAGAAEPSRSLPLGSLARRVIKSKSFRDMKFLFTSWYYVSFLASNFLLYFWYDITYTFLPDHAKEIGLSTSDVSLIIGLIGVSNTVGQIAIGYIGDFPRVDSALLYALCMSLTGVANFLVPWCLNLASLLVYGIFYGFLVSANYSLCSIVLIDLFGLERLTTGYGFMMFFQGVANLVGPPAMGHMRDSDSNYHRAFIYSGVFVFASNLLILPVYRTLYRSTRDCWRGGGCGGGEGGPTTEASAPGAEAEAAQRVPLTST